MRTGTLFPSEEPAFAASAEVTHRLPAEAGRAAGPGDLRVRRPVSRGGGSPGRRDRRRGRGRTLGGGRGLPGRRQSALRRARGARGARRGTASGGREGDNELVDRGGGRPYGVVE